MSEIDISSKLGKKKATIKVAEDKVYEVNTSADNYLQVQEKMRSKDFSIEVMYDMIEMLMGKKALEEIKEMKLTIKGLEAIIIAMSAVVSEVTYEEMEKRFQDNK